VNGLHPADALPAVLAVIALLGGWLALRRAIGTRHKAGLPPGRVVYADTGNWRSPDAPFFSATHGLTGKPDYVVRTRAGLVPVEVKSSSTPPQPYSSHILQLAAYCLLVEENEGRAPPHGLIKYPDAVFKVDYTASLRRELLGRLEKMRSLRSQRATRRGVPRSHNEPHRCAGCGYRDLCDQSLV
jgi:CRISPR-associated exonuclease Cas4